MRIVHAILLAIIVLAALPFGAVPMWAWSAIAVALALLLLVWVALSLIDERPPPVTPMRLWGPVLLFVLVCLWIVFQASSWSPRAWHHPLWAEAAVVLGEADIAGAISLSPVDSLSGLVRLMMYAVAFWLTLQLCRNPERARLTLTVLAISGGLYAAYGIAVELSDAKRILWFEKTSNLDVLTSTFVNRNNYATFAGLGLVAATARLFLLVDDYAPRGGSWRFRLHEGIMLLTTRGPLLITSWFLLIVALLMTQSRGGLVVAVAGLLVFNVSLFFRRSEEKEAAGGFVRVILIGFLFFVALAGSAVIDRFSAENKFVSRAEMYARTLDGIEDHRWTGTGFGTFQTAFRLYRSEEMQRTLARAHSSYLENILELGYPAALALFAIPVWLTLICLRGILRRRRDAIYCCVGVSASVLVGLHAAFDFSLQIPAVSLLYMVLLGIGCAQAWSTRSGSGRRRPAGQEPS